MLLHQSLPEVCVSRSVTVRPRWSNHFCTLARLPTAWHRTPTRATTTTTTTSSWRRVIVPPPHPSTSITNFNFYPSSSLVAYPIHKSNIFDRLRLVLFVCAVGLSFSRHFFLQLDDVANAQLEYPRSVIAPDIARVSWLELASCHLYLTSQSATSIYPWPKHEHTQ